MRNQQPTAGSEFDAPETYRPTDKELGIGEEAEVVTDASQSEVAASELVALMQRPEFAMLIDAAVEARIKAMGAVGEKPAGAAPDLATLIEGLAKAIDRNASASASQQPGYVKPLPPEEIEARAAAFVEMGALLTQAKSGGGERPVYLLSDYLYAGDMQWYAGDSVYWNDIPNTAMEPQNDIAKRIYAQFERWIGGRDAPSLIDQAVEARNERLGIAGAPSLPPPVGPSQLTPVRFNERGIIELVPGTMRRDMAPRRSLGTVVPEHTPQDPQNIMGTVPNIPVAAQGA